MVARVGLVGRQRSHLVFGPGTDAGRVVSGPPGAASVGVPEAATFTQSLRLSSTMRGFPGYSAEYVRTTRDVTYSGALRALRSTRGGGSPPCPTQTQTVHRGQDLSSLTSFPVPHKRAVEQPACCKGPTIQIPPALFQLRPSESLFQLRPSNYDN